MSTIKSKMIDELDQNQEMQNLQNENSGHPRGKENNGKGKAGRDTSFGIKLIVGLLIVVVAITYGINLYTNYANNKNAVSYDELIADLRAGKIEKVTECSGYVSSKYRDVDQEKTTFVGEDAAFVKNMFSKMGLDLDPTTVKGDKCQDTLKPADVFSWVINILFIVLIGYIAWKVLTNLNENGSKIFGFGESKAKFIIGKKQDITLKDVGGVSEAKDELNEIIMFLKTPEKFRKLGARIPKGILMVGAPGTGKTLLARAIAGEAGVPFFIASGSEFEEMLVGAGASRVRDLFSKAKKVAPSLIFIDEIDAVGKKRGTSINSSATEQTLNQILVEMDGFDKNQNVIVIAATNRPDVLDPALLRPGRFDRKITLDLPDQDGRLEILKLYAKNKPLAEDVDLSKIAKRAIGYTGADLENILNEAAIAAAKHDQKEITGGDMEEAALKLVMGTARKRRRTEKELATIAYHEAGHALVTKFVPEADPVHKITIVSRGMSGGMTMHMPEEDENLVSRTKMLSSIKMLLGGFVSEKIFMGDVTTGASNDIERASKIARDMVKKYGMTTLGTIEYGQDDEFEGYGVITNYSEITSQEIDAQVRKIMAECLAETEKIISEHKVEMEKLKKMLLEKEIVTFDEYSQIFE